MGDCGNCEEKYGSLPPVNGIKFTWSCNPIGGCTIGGCNGDKDCSHISKNLSCSKGYCTAKRCSSNRDCPKGKCKNGYCIQTIYSSWSDVSWNKLLIVLIVFILVLFVFVEALYRYKTKHFLTPYVIKDAFQKKL